MAPPGDAEPTGIRDAGRHEVVNAGQDVGPLAATHGAGHHVGECPAVSLASARVGVEHREAGRGKPLTPRPPACHELVGPPAVRAAVDDRHQGERTVRPAPAWRQDQHAVEFQPVRCPPSQPFLGAPGDAAQFRTGVADLDESIRRASADVRRRVGRARHNRDHGRVITGGEAGGVAGQACHPFERRSPWIQPVQGGVQSFREQCHRRTARDLSELVWAGGHPGGQVDGLLPRDGDIEHGRGADGRHGGQPGNMPAVGALPPRGRACLEARRAQVDRGSRVQVGDVQSAGEGTRLVLRAVPAYHRERSPTWPLRDADDVPPSQSGGQCEFPGGHVEQAQPVPEPVPAHCPLGPDHHIVAPGLAAFVVLG